MDKNLLSAECSHKMLYHQTTTNQTKINELKTIPHSTRKNDGIKNVFANNSDDSRINEMLYSLKLEAFIMSIHKSVMSLCFLS